MAGWSFADDEEGGLTSFWAWLEDPEAIRYLGKKDKEWLLQLRSQPIPNRSLLEPVTTMVARRWLQDREWNAEGAFGWIRNFLSIVCSLEMNVRCYANIQQKAPTEDNEAEPDTAAANNDQPDGDDTANSTAEDEENSEDDQENEDAEDGEDSDNTSESDESGSGSEKDSSDSESDTSSVPGAAAVAEAGKPKPLC